MSDSRKNPIWVRADGAGGRATTRGQHNQNSTLTRCQRIYICSANKKSEEKRQCSSKLQACGEYCGPPQATCYSGQCSHRPRHSFSPDGSPKRQKNACTKKKMKLKKKNCSNVHPRKEIRKNQTPFHLLGPPVGATQGP